MVEPGHFVCTCKMFTTSNTFQGWLGQGGVGGGGGGGGGQKSPIATSSYSLVITALIDRQPPKLTDHLEAKLGTV